MSQKCVQLKIHEVQNTRDSYFDRPREKNNMLTSIYKTYVRNVICLFG